MLDAPVTTLIPGIADFITVSFFAVGTGIFVFAMKMIHKSLKTKKKAKESLA